MRLLMRILLGQFTPPVPSASRLVTEDGNALITESGDSLVTE
jgi:hypothetical protein